MLLLSMMSSCSVDKCWLTLLPISEALSLSVLKLKLEIQTLQSGKAFSTNAFKDKSLSNTILDVSLTVLFVTLYSIIFLWAYCSHRCPQLLHQERFHFDFSPLTQYSVFFNTRYNGITYNERGVFTPFVMDLISQADVLRTFIRLY